VPAQLGDHTVRAASTPVRDGKGTPLHFEKIREKREKKRKTRFFKVFFATFAKFAQFALKILRLFISKSASTLKCRATRVSLRILFLCLPRNLKDPPLTKKIPALFQEAGI